MSALLRRVLRHALWLLPLLLLGAVVWLFESEAGLRFALARADAALGGRLAIAHARGTLAGPLEIDGLALDLGNTRVTVASLRLDLDPGPLLLGRVQLPTLEARGVRIVITPDPTAPPFVLPERIDLPVHLALERFTIEDVEIAVGGAAPLRLARITGAMSADAHGLRLSEVEATQDSGSLRGSATLGLAQPYPVSATLVLAAAHDGRPLAIETTLGGQLERLEIGVTSASPLAARAALLLTDPFGTPHLAGTVECHGLQPAALDRAFAVSADATLDCALRLAATGDTTRISGRLGYAHPGYAPATLDIVLRASRKEAVLDSGRLAFRGAPLRATLHGKLALAATAHPFALDAAISDLAMPTATPGPILAPQADLALRGDLAAATAELTLTAAHGGTLHATAAFAPQRRTYTLDAETQAWPLGAATLERATLHASGDAAGADLTTEGALALGATRAGFHARGRLTPRALDLSMLQLETLGGRIGGSARLELGATPTLHARLVAHDLDPRTLDPRFPGRIAARLTLDGTPAQATLVVDALSGTLRERALAGHARLRWADPRRAVIGPRFAPAFALEDADLTLGGARLRGSLAAPGAEFTLAAPDLADLAPGAKGRLDAQLSLGRGTALGPVGTIALDGAGIAFGTVRVATLKGELRAPAAGELGGEFAASGFAFGSVSADSLRFGMAGPRDALRLTFRGERSGSTLELAVHGALDAAGFTGTLEQLDVAPADLARWKLVAPSALRIGSAGVSVASACLSDGNARGCLEGGWHPLQPWRVRSKVEHLTLGAFGGLLARGLDYHGEIALDLDATGRGPELDAARAVLALTAGGVVLPARRGHLADQLLEFSGGRIELERDSQRISAKVALELAGHGEIDATLETPSTGGPLATRPLKGRLRAHADRFDLLPVLVPELKRLEGRFEADVALAGTVDQPSYAGRIAFLDGITNVPRYGLALDKVRVELVGDKDALTLTGSARSGGTVQWHADLRRDGERWRANGRLWGEGFTAIDVPEARIVASPAMLFELDGHDLKVTGEVTVPKARLAPRSLASAVQSSNDEVVVESETAPATSAELRIDARLRLKLGAGVKFDGFGLKSGISGELMLTQRPDALALASGDLTLEDGEYEAYGQKLAIERGRLLFSGGPVNNPGIDVHATRKIEDSADDVVVGIDVRGTLREPRTTVFATPAMSSSDALAYLVLGRPMIESTEADQKQLTDATASMKLSGGEFIAQQIGRQIGLDEVRITDSGDPSQAQLWLGTYLSPRLFVSYGMGLFEQIHTARVRYEMSRRWSIEAESGQESSADIKYTIER